MNKRKLLTLALTLCMVAILAIGGTLAYFTDDEQATNVMTIGNVEINIEERTYDHENSKWTAFENEKLTLYPVDHTDWEAMKASGQAWNKVVRTFNTSSSQDAAYIRTIIAVESIPYAGQWKTAVGVNFSSTKVNYNVWPDCIKLEDGTTYDVYVCTAKDMKPVEYGKYLESLTSVYLYADVTAEEAADANGKLDIKVLSQGIQAAGFQAAGESDADAHADAMAALGEINADKLNAWFFGNNKAENANVNEFANFGQMN